VETGGPISTGLRGLFIIINLNLSNSDILWAISWVVFLIQILIIPHIPEDFNVGDFLGTTGGEALI
jgi:hypothetical protein